MNGLPTRLPIRPFLLPYPTADTAFPTPFSGMPIRPPTTLNSDSAFDRQIPSCWNSVFNEPQQFGQAHVTLKNVVSRF